MSENAQLISVVEYGRHGPTSRRGVPEARIQKGLHAVQLLERAQEREDELRADLASVRSERDELRSAYDRLASAKDGIIERLTTDHASERRRLLELLISEQSRARDAAFQLQAALAQLRGK